VSLEIDYREREILAKMEGFSDINFTNQNLLIGDFIFRNERGEILLIIERKTIKDLCASIIDSRFREQKERLIESVHDPSKIVYILEGSKRIKGKGTLSKTIMDSAIQNLIFKHQFKVLFTESVDDTVDQLKMFYKKLKDDSFSLATVQPATLIKKSSKIIDNIYINQLSVIPGVSLSIANKISERYPSFFELIKAYTTSTNCELLLADIQLGNKRKLGKCLSKKIYECLMDVAKVTEDVVTVAEDVVTVAEDVVNKVEDDKLNVKLNCVL
jgi:crossover junction endonuclease MUS81